MNSSLARTLSVAIPLLLACSSPAPASTADAASSDAPSVVDAADAPADAPADATDATDATPVDAAFALAPGEVAEVPLADGTASLRLATPTGAERFVVVLASTHFDARADAHAYQTATELTAPAAVPTVVTGCSLDDARWRAMTLPTETAPTGDAPAIGTERSFAVPLATGMERITARVVAVSERAVVWADTTAAHPATLDMAFIAGFLSDFDHTIVPRERTAFGTESDLDHDGHIALLFSPLTNRTAVAFFSQCDLQRTAGCPSTNASEVIYLTPPNVIRPPYNTAAAMNEILAHELGHLIHFGRKVLRNRLTAWSDNAYIIEGTGALAQDVIGFQAGNLYVTQAGLDSVNLFSLSDILADGARYDTARDGALRGGAYLFVRWLYDRGGGDSALAGGAIENRGGPAFLRALIDSPETVVGALPSVGMTTLPDLAMDFFTTLAVSNRDHAGASAPANRCFSYLPVAQDPVTMRPRGADVFATFHGMQMHGPATQPLATADGALLPGGAEYLTLNAAEGATELTASVTVDAAALARVRVARIQ